MKNLLYLFALLTVLTFFGGCSAKNHRPAEQTPLEKQAMNDDYLTGEVTEIQPGKDGYTAKLVTPDRKVYFATISRANLKENAAQYRTVAIGETIAVKGDVFQLGEQTHLTVRALR